jgi:hypothetical protein
MLTLRDDTSRRSTKHVLCWHNSRKPGSLTTLETVDWLLRRFPVKDFENYMIFDIPRHNGIEIVRALHAASNITSVLAEES